MLHGIEYGPPLTRPVCGSQTDRTTVRDEDAAHNLSLPLLSAIAGLGRARRMGDREDFLDWVRTALYEAEVALHKGDAAPRRALWSRHEPVSVLGAWRNAHGQRELDELFAALAESFSDCTSYTFDLQACDVAGDMAYTAGLEHTSASVDGRPRSYTLRATQVYRREGGDWKVAHRHGDTVVD
jgi:ketosteroid isomerase-like protein